MALTRKQNENETPKKTSRLVFTGKRVKGIWSLESGIPVGNRTSNIDQNVLVTENRRVRTLH